MQRQKGALVNTIPGCTPSLGQVSSCEQEHDKDHTKAVEESPTIQALSSTPPGEVEGGKVRGRDGPAMNWMKLRAWTIDDVPHDGVPAGCL